MKGNEDREHILTINAEEYFHGGALSNVVLAKHWDRLESRLDHSIEHVLELLDRHGFTATFFVLGWSAEHNPGVIRRIVEAGHEVASRGFWPRGVSETLPDEFRDSLRRTNDALVAAGAPEVRGFRCPRWIDKDDLWVLDVLAEEGFAYDASVNPRMRSEHGSAFHTVRQHRHSTKDLSIWEVPVSTISLLGLRLPISGGNYLRQLPQSLMRRAVDSWTHSTDAPLVFYFTPWELDASQPQISAVSTLNRVRQYRNQNRMESILETYFARFRFHSIADHLGLESNGGGAPVRQRAVEAAARPRRDPDVALKPATIVVPAYNEEESLAYLDRTLQSLFDDLANRYEFQCVFVDDASTDDTWQALNERFGDREGVKLVRHPENRGVAGAILTGIENADHEIICTIDSDCSYDPANLAQMIPLLEEADLVTASPYHPRGRVFNVPKWRLFLSRNLSRLYSLLVGERFYTFTACFRVQRKSAFEGLKIENGGFLGIAEILLKLKRANARIVEYPATLESRLLGTSKMKTLRTIRGHLRLLWQLAFKRGPFRA